MTEATSSFLLRRTITAMSGEELREALAFDANGLSVALYRRLGWVPVLARRVSGRWQLFRHRHGWIDATAALDEAARKRE